jgi:DNA-binding transcriptional regulator/RsmH inhibitor MraZ
MHKKQLLKPEIYPFSRRNTGIMNAMRVDEIRRPGRQVLPQGVFGSSLDEKHRFMIPKTLQRAGYSGELVLVPSVNRLTNQKVLRIFTRVAWEKMRDSLPEEQRDSFVMHSQEIKLDSSGRTLLPKEILAQLEFAGTERLVVVNQGDHLRVWRRADYYALPLPTF